MADETDAGTATAVVPDPPTPPAPVRVDDLDGVLVVTIDRPEVRNAIDLATACAIADAMDRLDADPTLVAGVNHVFNFPGRNTQWEVTIEGDRVQKLAYGATAWTTTSVALLSKSTYPRVSLLPNGKFFVATPADADRKNYVFDPTAETVALAGNSISDFALAAMKASRWSSRAGTAANTMPAGMRVGRSFMECTAASMRPSSRASSSSLVNRPLPPWSCRRPWIRSPLVMKVSIGTDAASSPVCFASSPATRWDWASARGEPREPMRRLISTPQ